MAAGSSAPEAAGAIHTDFQRGFIRAETISFDDYIACKGESGARDAGKLRIEGADYKVVDGDVFHFVSTYSRRHHNRLADTTTTHCPQEITMSEMIKLTAEDGIELAACVAGDPATAKGGVVVLQEIFGLNTHIRDLPRRFAEADIGRSRFV